MKLDLKDFGLAGRRSWPLLHASWLSLGFKSEGVVKLDLKDFGLAGRRSWPPLHVSWLNLGFGVQGVVCMEREPEG